MPLGQTIATGGASLAESRAAEAEAFRAAVSRLRQARAGGAGRRAAAVRATRRLWQAVLLAVCSPACPLPDALRDGFGLLGSAVLRELEREQPDLDFLIMVNEQVVAGLATYH
ncbi:flagellar biosynthesis regulator FlaF [Teichococcus aestuarii]|uniref:Uncharacterized protein n=1 Tax=Teichococcus aestuarii TaxID=568898 RepID=A0A2U1V704_9PROT|nr:flagellar biosynthesis regulator FlaF [Pseudoroseomonas aestuarii]PWC29675.1 hypothetical protein CR165_07000 [Pseudoroseomonas aestuarii]